MKTENDLRLEFKKETGLNAFDLEEVQCQFEEFAKLLKTVQDGFGNFESAKIEDFQEAFEELTTVVEALDVEFEAPEDTYLRWLEEKLIEKWT